jgi:hypothetical protein
MSQIVGHAISIAAFVVPAFVLALLGLWFGNWNTAAGLAIIWIGGLFAVTIRIQQKKTFTVIERFGKLWDVKFAGLRLIIPYIDNQILRENFLQKSVELFKDMEIDFVGGSAPVLADAWYQVGNPADLDDGDEEAIERVRSQVLKYTYRVRAEDRAARVADIFRGSFRTYLETRTIAEAQAEAEDLANKAVEGIPEREGAKVALAEIGVFPFPGKGIIVRDIVLPPIIIQLREQVLRGEMDAKEAVARAQVYWKPLTEMKTGFVGAGPGRMELTDGDILRLFLAQKGLDTLQRTPSNVTLIAKDIDNLQKIITVGEVSTGKGGSS